VFGREEDGKREIGEKERGGEVGKREGIVRPMSILVLFR